MMYFGRVGSMTVAMAVTEGRVKEHLGNVKENIIVGQVREMKSFLIIGVGRFGRHLATKLVELGNEVMVVDKDEEKDRNKEDNKNV